MPRNSKDSRGPADNSPGKGKGSTDAGTQPASNPESLKTPEPERRLTPLKSPIEKFESLVEGNSADIEEEDGGPHDMGVQFSLSDEFPEDPETSPGRLTPLRSPIEKLEKVGKQQRSKFGKNSMKKALKTLRTVTPTEEDDAPLLERRDARYSKEHHRYSFDVNVLGPFTEKTYPEKVKAKSKDIPLPEVREVGTQAMLVSSSDEDWDEEPRLSRSSGGYTQEEAAAGDASSSVGSEKDEEIPKGKVLERKESKRREAETMARPRGYKDLNLSEEMPFVTCEAETQVSSNTLDKEEATKKGLTIPKDDILWPSCNDFDPVTIPKKIEDYIKRFWTLDPKWLFMVQPLDEYFDNFRRRHVFEVKFSVPSPTPPVPAATASVFFTFEMTIYSSKNDPVLVSYVLEGTRYAHKTGKIPFQDKWLWGIISDKLRLQKAVNF